VTTEKPKTYHCKASCTKGCKNCKCAQLGEKCDTECGCSGCKNRGELDIITPVEEEFKFNKTEWKINGVCTTKIPESERTTGQIRNIPKHIMDNATPLRVFELLFH